jgi:8-oxo-dGTP pyrophosphatase MutT (NUDIX family)
LRASPAWRKSLSTMLPAQDEGELFDLYDEGGAPLGIAKPRGLVHRDGDWHRSLHIWVWGLLGDGPREPFVVLQRRSAGKDTHPLRLDAAVTGHLAAGETVDDALREAEEEIGLTVTAAELIRVGLRRRSDRSRAGVIDNELQDIFAMARPVTITALRPSPAELEALVAVPLRDARALVEGGEVQGLRLVQEGGAARLAPETLRGSEMVPAPDGYYGWALDGLSALPAVVSAR